MAFLTEESIERYIPINGQLLEQHPDLVASTPSDPLEILSGLDTSRTRPMESVSDAGCRAIVYAGRSSGNCVSVIMLPPEQEVEEGANHEQWARQFAAHAAWVMSSDVFVTGVNDHVTAASALSSQAA